MPQYSTKLDLLRYNIFTSNYECNIYTKIKGDLGKLHHCQKAILERDQLRVSRARTSIIVENMSTTSLICMQLSRHDSYSQFSRSPLGTPGTVALAAYSRRTDHYY